MDRLGKGGDGKPFGEMRAAYEAVRRKGERRTFSGVRPLRPAPLAQEGPVNGHLAVEEGSAADAPRDSHVNFKATVGTDALIAAIAKARNMSRAELLKDMVAG